MKKLLTTILSILTLLLIVSCSTEQEGNAIPYQLDEWKGVQGKTLEDSKPDFVGPPKAPEEAPNVLVIMLDDAGYSNAGSFGGDMKTPAFDRIGDDGCSSMLSYKGIIINRS